MSEVSGTGQRGLLAGELLVRAVKKEIRPVCHVAKPPMILNLLGQDTAREPMAGLMRQAREVEKRPGVLSVSLMAGFPYADVPEMGPAVIAVTDGKKAQAKAVAGSGIRPNSVRVAIFAACPFDTVFADVGRATVAVLERLGSSATAPSPLHVLGADAPEFWTPAGSNGTT